MGQQTNFRRLTDKAFSLFTIFRSQAQAELEDAIKNFPQEFILYLTNLGMRDAKQDWLVEVLFSLAITEKGILKQYQPHIELLFKNHLSLRPSAVDIVRTQLSRFGFNFLDPAFFS